MIDLVKEREAFEATRVGEFVNVEFEVNDYWKTGHYKEKTSHYEDLEESHTLSMSWFAWLARAELAQAEITELKQKLAESEAKQSMWRDEKNHAIKRWHDITQDYNEKKQKHGEMIGKIHAMKKKLARYENPDFVLVPRVATKEMLNALDRGFYCDFYDNTFTTFDAYEAHKYMIEAVSKSDNQSVK